MANVTTSNTQKSNNYFSINAQKFGDNFVAQKSAQDIQRDAKKKLFKDMVFGNIDYDVYGQYFTDATFLDNLITVAMNERDIHFIEAEALNQYDLTHPGGTIAPVKAVQHREAMLALDYIFQSLVNVKNSGMNIMYLTGITTAVHAWKRSFSEFY